MKTLLKTSVVAIALSGCATETPEAPEPEVAVVEGAMARAQLPVYSGSAATQALAQKPMNEHVTVDGPTIDAYERCIDCATSTGKDPGANAVTSQSVTHDDAVPDPRIFDAVIPPRFGSAANDPLQKAWTKASSKAHDYLNPATGISDNVREVLGEIHEVLKDTLGNLSPNVTITGGEGSVVEKQWARWWRPTFGRQLVRKQSVNGAVASYNNSTLFGELTDRGARSYCGMKNAAEAQHATGAGTLLDQTLLEDAAWWDFGVTKTDVTIGAMGPSNKVLEYPGAQAFVMPMIIGSKVAPVVGPLIPDLGTFTHPLVWVAGDSEAITKEDYGPVTSVMGGSHNEYRKDYRNLAHLDAFAGKQYSGNVGFEEALLADFGIFQLMFGGDITVDVGIPNAATQATRTRYASGQAWVSNIDTGWPAARSNALDDVPESGDDVSDAPIGVFACEEGQLMNPSFEDLAEGVCTVHPKYDADETLGLDWADIDGTWEVDLEGAMAARLRHDDDRSLTVTDRAGIAFQVQGRFGFDFGIIKIGVVPELEVGMTSQIDTVVREQVSTVQGDAIVGSSTAAPELQTNLLVTSVPTHTFTFNPLTVGLELAITLPFIGTVEWAEDLFQMPSISADLNDPLAGKESDRLRVGELSTHVTNALNHAIPTASHLPGGYAFQSQTSTIQDCLTDPDPVTNEPPVEETTPGPGPVLLNACYVGIDADGFNKFVKTARVYTGVPIEDGTPFMKGDVLPLPVGVCDDDGLRNGYVARFKDADQAGCIGYTIDYLCGRITDTEDQSSWGQVDNSWSGITHVLKDEDASYSNEMWGRCAEAFATSHLDDEGKMNIIISHFLAQIMVHNFVAMRTCDEHGNLIYGGQPEQCNPDAWTHDCWSFHPCYFDEETQTCDSQCEDTTGCDPEWAPIKVVP